MATTVAQHSIATFTSPINGTTPIDANSVRGNDNTIRSSYNDHDADAGIHLQSSALSARPVAGDAGRKWLTNDTGAVRLYLDTGSAWAEISYLPLAGGTVAGNVSVTGTLAVTGVLTASGGVVGNITGNADTATKLSSSRTFAVTGDVTGSVSSDLTTGASIGTTLASGVVSNTNVSASAAIAYSKLALTGSIVNADVSASAAIADTKLATISTAGKVANSATTAVSTNTANAIVARDASGNFAAGTITAALTGNASTATTLQTARTINGVSFNGSADITVTAAAGTLTGTTLAANVTASSLTSVGTLANLTVTNPITGSVTGSSGSTTGNAATATALQTARNINGVSFNGTADITVAAAAGTLTGTTLASGVTASSLTSVGTLSSLTVSGNLTVDTNTLFVDAPNNRVGIGTTSPSHALSIVNAALGIVSLKGGNATDQGSAYRLELAGGTGTLAAFGDRARLFGGTPDALVSIFTGTQPLTFDVNAAERMRLTASGDLGLGASTITAIFGRTLQISDGTANGSLSLVGSSGNGFIATNGTKFLVNGRGGMALSLGTNDTEKALIDTAGNLGLGVTPSAWSGSLVGALQFAGAASLASHASARAMYLSENAFWNGANWRYIATDFATQYQQFQGQHQWYTAPSGTAGNAITFTQAMTLTAAGNLGIGTTTPSSALEVVGEGSIVAGGGGDRWVLSPRGATVGAKLVAVNNANNAYRPATLTGSIVVFETNGETERGRIDASGNVLIGMTATAASSAKTLHLGNATVPTANPTGGGVLYVEAGALKYRGSSGTVTTIANA